MRNTANRRRTETAADILRKRRVELLQFVASNIKVAVAHRIKDPELRSLHSTRQRNLAKDRSKYPFSARKDLRKSHAERGAMNLAYQRLMAGYAYEASEVRDRASRHFVAWITRFARPHATADEIIQAAFEVGAARP